MSILLYIFTICIIERCFIFFQRDVAFWKALIPGYNKYLLGKMCGCKKLGIATAIVLTLCFGTLIGIYCFEMWIVRTHPIYYSDIAQQFVVEGVTETIVFWLRFMQYALIFLAALSVICWSWMMLKFSQMHKKSNWWILLWAVCPILPYTILAFSKRVAVNCKQYDVKKIECKVTRHGRR